MIYIETIENWHDGRVCNLYEYDNDGNILLDLLNGSE